MQIYMVGGAVRDALLGLPVQDRDWVVVGSTPQAMLDAGYLPVGRDFPVFLHPQTREEYALARTERKTAAGYHGFAFHAHPSVTLHEDLGRRDLTINALAVPLAHAFESDLAPHVIDAHTGLADLQAQVLRHITPAFAEDPVRILRLARFAARFEQFAVAPETTDLMRQMVRQGEVDALVPERVWAELSRALMQPQPARAFELLRDVGALARVLPELDRPWSPRQSKLLHAAQALNAPLVVRAACLLLGADAELAEPAGSQRLHQLCERLRVPSDPRELAELLVRERQAVHHSANLDALGLQHLLERCDALRKPDRMRHLLLACTGDALSADPAMAAKSYRPAALIHTALDASLSVATAPIAKEAAALGLRGPQVGERISQARAAAIRLALAPAV